jgi:hypothetical protein
MMNRLCFVLISVLALGTTACGGEDPVAQEDTVIFPKKDISQPPLVVDLVDAEPDVSEIDLAVMDETSLPDLPPIQTGCGDGLCQGAETVQNCAKDCLEATVSVAFVFAHKGDELAALGRIHDLVQGGAQVFVFYLTFDDTPIGTVYANAPQKLAVAALGVPAENIYLYEQYLDWHMVSGTREVLDRLTQHLKTISPEALYLPQLAGGDIEDEVAHVIGLQAAKRASVFPEYFEVPVPSNYFVGTEPPLETAQQDPDGFVNHFIKRWKLIPKSTDELKPTLGSAEMVTLRLAAAHIMNDWFQGFLYQLPEDRLLYLLREIQRYRELPGGQKVDKRPFIESLDNPGTKYIYEEEGFTFDEFKQRARIIQSFYGCDARTEPSALPWFDEPIPVTIMHDYELILDVRSFSPDPDEFSFVFGWGPAKNETDHCQPIAPVQVSAFESLQLPITCQAKNEIGVHTYFVRVYSAQADEWDDAATFVEIPFRVKIANF